METRKCTACGTEYDTRYKFARYCPNCKAKGLGSSRSSKKAAPISQETVEDTIPEQVETTIEVVDPIEKEAQGVASRILQGLGIDVNQPLREKSKAKREKKEKFFRSMVPLVSNLSVLAVRSRISEDYKSCAPLESELIAVLNPIANVIDRRIDVSAAMSPDVEDLLACMYAMGRMTIRIWDTKNQIDEKIDGRKSSEQPVRTASTGAVVRDLRTDEKVKPLKSRSITPEYYASLPPEDDGHHTTSQGANPGTGEFVVADGRQALSIIQTALSRDFDYRQSQGML